MFYLSAVIQTPWYLEAVMYTKLSDGRIVPRILYKSNSDGGWRSTPGYYAGGGFSKGRGVSYTQETKPHEAINRYFNEMRYIQDFHLSLLLLKFEISTLDPSVNTFMSEQTIYNDRDALKEIQKYPPGSYSVVGKGVNFGQTFSQFNFSSQALVGFVPNFNVAPETVETSKHTLLGDITLETYPGVLQGRPVKWVMAYDNQGRTWIDRIYFADTSVNSYGVYSEIINSGALTNKPLEYRNLISQLQPNTDYVDFNKEYVDITPLLANLLPIRQFLAARNNKRTVVARPQSRVQPPVAVNQQSPAAANAPATNSLLINLKQLATNSKVESGSTYLPSLKAATAILRKGSGIVTLQPDVETLVVSDLHARRDFLMEVLQAKRGGVTVLELLRQGKINVVLVGDAVHSEVSANWPHIWDVDYDQKMNAEMARNLNIMKMIMDLKAEFPDNFHYIRGNHDEINGTFTKYANEGYKVRKWMEKTYGKDFVAQWAAFEDALPILAIGKTAQQSFVISHTVPNEVLGYNQINRRDPAITVEPNGESGLLWTDNTRMLDNQLTTAIRGTLRNLGLPENSQWIIGHRDVDKGTLYRSQLGGQLVQINDKQQHLVALIPTATRFDPKVNVTSLNAPRSPFANKDNTCSSCNIVIQFVMNLVAKAQDQMFEDRSAALTTITQAKQYLDHYFANQPVFDGLNADVEVAEAQSKPTQAEKDDALRAVQKAIDSINRALQDGSLSTTDRAAYQADLEGMQAVQSSLDLLEVTPSSWTEYVSVGVTNTANAVRRWVNTGKNVIGEQFDQVAGNQPNTLDAPTTLRLDVNPRIDLTEMKVGGLEYTHLDPSLASTIRYGGEERSRRLHPLPLIYTSTGEPYWAEKTEYQLLVEYMEADQYSPMIEEARQILGANNVMGHSITGSFGTSREYADGLRLILDFGYRTIEGEPIWMGTFQKSGIGASAGDFFHGYAALVILPEDVSFDDILVEDPILHQKFIPPDYLLYVFGTPEQAKLFKRWVNSDVFSRTGWYPTGTNLNSWLDSHVVSLADIIEHKNDLTTLSPLTTYILPSKNSSTQSPAVSLLNQNPTQQLQTAVLSDYKGVLEKVDFTSQEAPQLVQKLVEEEYARLHPGLSPPTDLITSVTSALLAQYKGKSPTSQVKPATSGMLYASLPGLPQLAAWLGPKLEQAMPVVKNTFDTVRNSLSGKSEQKKKANEQPQTSEVQQPVPVGTDLEKMIAELQSQGKGSPPSLSAEDTGTAGAFVTNEWAPPSFVDSVRSKKIPNGYLVGPTVGSIFSLLDLYSQGESPKGIIVTDINPEVILLGKMFVRGLQMYPTFEDMQRALFNIYRTDLAQKIFTEVVQSEENSILKEKFQSISQDRLLILIKQMANSYENDHYNKTPDVFYNNENRTINVTAAIQKHYTMLRNFALQGKMAMLYADLSDPVILSEIQKLPQYTTSTNIVYLSNVADILFVLDTYKGDYLKQYHQNLTKYINPSDIVVHTLRQIPGTYATDYQLMYSFGMPTWTINGPWLDATNKTELGPTEERQTITPTEQIPAIVIELQRLMPRYFEQGEMATLQDLVFIELRDRGYQGDLSPPLQAAIDSALRAAVAAAQAKGAQKQPAPSGMLYASLPGLPQLAAWLGPKIEQAMPVVKNAFDTVRNGLNGFLKINLDNLSFFPKFSVVKDGLNTVILYFQMGKLQTLNLFRSWLIKNTSDTAVGISQTLLDRITRDRLDRTERTRNSRLPEGLTDTIANIRLGVISVVYQYRNLPLFRSWAAKIASDDIARFYLLYEPTVSEREAELGRAKALASYFRSILTTLPAGTISSEPRNVGYIRVNSSLTLSQLEVVQAIHARLGTADSNKISDDQLLFASASILNSLRNVQNRFGNLDNYREFFRQSVAANDAWIQEKTGWAIDRSDQSVILPFTKTDHILNRDVFEWELMGRFNRTSRGLFIFMSPYEDLAAFQRTMIHELTHVSQINFQTVVINGVLVSSSNRQPQTTFVEAVTEGLALSHTLHTKHKLSYWNVAQRYTMARDALLQAGVDEQTVWQSFIGTGLRGVFVGKDGIGLPQQHANVFFEGFQTLYDRQFGDGAFIRWMSEGQINGWYQSDRWFYDRDTFSIIERFTTQKIWLQQQVERVKNLLKSPQANRGSNEKERIENILPTSQNQTQQTFAVSKFAGATIDQSELQIQQLQPTIIAFVQPQLVGQKFASQVALETEVQNIVGNYIAVHSDLSPPTIATLRSPAFVSALASELVAINPALLKNPFVAMIATVMGVVLAFAGIALQSKYIFQAFNAWKQMKNTIAFRFLTFRQQIRQYIAFIQLDGVVLNVKDLVRVFNTPAITQEENLYGLPYSIQNPEGIIIKTGILKQQTEITIPIKGGYTLLIQKQAITGDAILKQYPDSRLQNPLHNLLYGILLWVCGPLFLFGSIVQFSLLLETKLMIDGTIHTHIAPYWALKSFLGTTIANMIVGQFRDLFSMAGMFVFINLFDSIKSSVGKWGTNIVSTIALTAIYGYIEYVFSIAKGVWDIPDLITFALPTVSMITLAVYQYMKLRKSNIAPIRSAFFASFPDIALPIIVFANTVLTFLVLILLGSG